ncbi:DoxX family protein [Hymenobacter latericus]|uniref:DoxX family protein n=1 Tax=Hymenobacter sp. YIM 151858-1 TaxID=2987688 RepID=UPI00222791EF|nr:DoxX family protein [Hymenobacter sp. YIM 151858-1]UYZ57848.1 DoxX family protein [Hymenobacter sp. YIM 151858-1]
MKAKATTALYYATTLLFSAFMLMAGIMELLQGPEGREIMRHLGYPEHVLLVLGAGKVLGALALVQNRYATLKEWAYAGFTFNFLGACAARAAAHDSTMLIVSPLLFLSFMGLSYLLWKKRQGQRLQSALVADATPAAQLAVA